MHLIIDDQEYPIVISRKKNKNAYIRIGEDNHIFVTVPWLYTDKQVKKLIEENKTSIERMIRKKLAKTLEGFWYLGKRYYIILTPLYELEFVNDKIYVKDEATLNKYLNGEMKRIFQEHLDYWYHKVEEKIPYPTLKIRKMKTRWGVCNRKNNTVTLNSELLKYSLDKLDYVIIHELSHFTHFDHSQSFWRLVEKYEPNYKKIRKELR